MFILENVTNSKKRFVITFFNILQTLFENSQKGTMVSFLNNLQTLFENSQKGTMVNFLNILTEDPYREIPKGLMINSSISHYFLLKSHKRG